MGTQVQLQIILDPDYLRDYLSVSYDYDVYIYRISCTWGEGVRFDHVFAFAGILVSRPPHVVGKTYLDLLLISYDKILKKKDANVQVNLTSFYFLEEDREGSKIVCGFSIILISKGIMTF